MTTTSTLGWNDDLQVVVSDLDETLAGLYQPTEPALVTELTTLLSDGLVLVLATGQGLNSTWERLVAHVPPPIRHRIFAGCCSGAELWGFDESGTARPLGRPCPLTTETHVLWRRLVRQLIDRFDLRARPTVELGAFLEATAGDPRAVMLADRQTQITLEMPNSGGVRDELVARANQLFTRHQLPVEAYTAATFAVDFVIAGVTKAAVIDALHDDPRWLTDLGVDLKWVTTPHLVEVWGDSFTSGRGEIDLRISQRLHPEVRSISFRDLDPDFSPGACNVVAWPGRHRLEAGVLEHVLSRHPQESSPW